MINTELIIGSLGNNFLKSLSKGFPGELLLVLDNEWLAMKDGLLPKIYYFLLKSTLGIQSDVLIKKLSWWIKCIVASKIWLWIWLLNSLNNKFNMLQILQNLVHVFLLYHHFQCYFRIESAFRWHWHDLKLCIYFYEIDKLIIGLLYFLKCSNSFIQYCNLVSERWLRNWV